MFVDMTLRKNPGLIRAAAALHREGRIGPNTYVIDRDAVRHNARVIKSAADSAGVALYFMTKQFGRNAAVVQALLAEGLTRAVAVDTVEAKALYRQGVAIGHVGHLVQIPRREIPDILAMEPEVVTVFGPEQAAAIARVAKDRGRVQPLLLRVKTSADLHYPGQEGGIDLSLLPAVARFIDGLPGVRVAGVTSFPCFIYNPDRREGEPTSNLATLLAAREILREALGREPEQINAPSLTCAATLPALARAGVTHGEPGHALTGTTPLHAFTEQPELPAMVYVSEVSHRDGDYVYTFGGGFYPRGNMQAALIGNTDNALRVTRVSVRPLPPEAIDYYGCLYSPAAGEVGDTVIYAFRTQIFTTRAAVAVVDGIREGRPRLVDLTEGR